MFFFQKEITDFHGESQKKSRYETMVKPMG